MVKKIQPKKEDVYIGVENSDQLRVNILENMKEIITFLKEIEKIKLLRQKKSNLISLTEIKIEELKKIIRRLQSLIPANKIASIKLRKEKKPVLKKIERDVGKPVIKKLTEVERLEEELRTIEEMLKKLK